MRVLHLPLSAREATGNSACHSNTDGKRRMTHNSLKCNPLALFSHYNLCVNCYYVLFVRRKDKRVTSTFVWAGVLWRTSTHTTQLFNNSAQNSILAFLRHKNILCKLQSWFVNSLTFFALLLYLLCDAADSLCIYFFFIIFAQVKHFHICIPSTYFSTWNKLPQPQNNTYPTWNRQSCCVDLNIPTLLTPAWENQTDLCWEDNSMVGMSVTVITLSSTASTHIYFCLNLSLFS